MMGERITVLPNTSPAFSFIDTSEQKMSKKDTRGVILRCTTN